MPPAPAKKDMIVATDYFTKWIEVEALSSTKDANNRLEGTKGKWVDELHGLLWAYQTTKRRSAGETPFSLAYEIEAIIPPHITVPSMSIEVGSIGQNSKQMKVNLDLLEGECERAIVQVASY
ncbi:unnamed protein product [Prunus armeniaca]